MKRVLLAALLLSLNFAFASAQGTCESRAVSREGKPLAGAAKASFLRKCKREPVKRGLSAETAGRLSAPQRKASCKNARGRHSNGADERGYRIIRALAPSANARRLIRRPVSKRCSVERIAALELARSQAGHEPPGALLRGTMGKGIGHDIALGLALQAVIANRGCGLHRSLDVARLDE